MKQILKGLVGSDELRQAFAVYAGFSRVALAVSGGSDSLALMHLSLAWRQATSAPNTDFIVLTVDHGLRPAAADEVKTVAKAAKAVGLDCQILTRKAPAGHTAVQANARADRYRMLCAAAREFGAGAIATGHTAEDQAETLLMRLARGSGVDGLAAMAPVSRIEDLALLRPMLGQTKRSLQAVLQDLGVAWIEDPSNADPAFERPRLRTPGLTLAAAGLSRDPLALSARRLGRARAALEAARDDANRALVTVNPDASVTIERAGFDALPEEIRLRLLAYWLGLMGTPGAAMRMARVERSIDQLATEDTVVTTFAGCWIVTARGQIYLDREPGRYGLPETPLAPGETVVWDRRFKIHLPATAKAGVVIRSARVTNLPPALDALRKQRKVRASDLDKAPAAFRGNDVVACPLIGVMTEPVSFEVALPDPKTPAADVPRFVDE